MSMWSPRCEGSSRASKTRRPRSSRRWRATPARSTRRNSRSRFPRRARTSLTRSLILWASPRRGCVRRPRRLGQPCRKRMPRWRSPPRRSRKPALRRRLPPLRWSAPSVRSRPRGPAHLLTRRLSLARSRRWPRREKRQRQRIRRPTRRPLTTRTRSARRRPRPTVQRPQPRRLTNASRRPRPTGSDSQPRSRGGCERPTTSSMKPARLIPRSASLARG